ncbi:hypothetical protein [Thorsellia kenyensis]|uniref:Uncharacterized protein n=1 Tax=Thorsellia kenyensis TaxID=1549888 RepID=A0ABV6C7H7_9GAMM
MKKILIILFFGFYSLSISADYDQKMTFDEMINEYKIYSLALCIKNNYEKMGVDFNQLPLKDITRGFIDIDAGLGFGGNGKTTNVLEDYIQMKTGHFYQPVHKTGDMASTNIVIYQFADFYESQELKDFLKKQIELRLLELGEDA